MSSGAFVPRSSWGSRRSDAVLGDSRSLRESKTYRKWESMAQRGLDRFLAAHPQTFLRRLRRGAPQDYRWEIWKVLLESKISGSSTVSSSPVYPEPRHVVSRVSSLDITHSNTGDKTDQLSERGNVDSSNNGHSSTRESESPYGKSVGGLGSPTSRISLSPQSNSKSTTFPSLPSLTMHDYLKLVESPSPFQNLINIDVPRTFPEIPSFDSSAQQQLARILNAFANYRPAVGYCQGMNFVVGFLLLVSDFREFDVFSAVVVLFESYGVEGLFRENFPLLSKYIEVYDVVAEDTIPALWKHFETEGVLPPVYLHQWFLTLYVRGLPLRTVVVLWDFLLAEGLQSLIPLTVALLRVLQRFLLRLKFEDAVKFLKSLKNSGDCDETEIGRMLVLQAEKVEIPLEMIEPLIDVDIEELIKTMATEEQRKVEAQRASKQGKITASSLDQYEAETKNKPNPLLQCVVNDAREGLDEDEDDDDKEYNYISSSDAVPSEYLRSDSRSAECGRHDSTITRTVPPHCYQQPDLLSGEEVQSNSVHDSRLRDAANSIGQPFLVPLTQSENFFFRRDRSESSSAPMVAPSSSTYVRTDYRLGYPASSAWASSGYRSIPTQLPPPYTFNQVTNHPNHLSDSQISHSSNHVNNQISNLPPTSSSSWFQTYQSPLWRFPHGYPPTSQHLKHQASLSATSHRQPTTGGHLSRVEPIHFQDTSRPIVSIPPSNLQDSP